MVSRRNEWRILRTHTCSDTKIDELGQALLPSFGADVASYFREFERASLQQFLQPHDAAVADQERFEESRWRQSPLLRRYGYPRLINNASERLGATIRVEPKRMLKIGYRLLRKLVSDITAHERQHLGLDDVLPIGVSLYILEWLIE